MRRAKFILLAIVFTVSISLTVKAQSPTTPPKQTTVADQPTTTPKAPVANPQVVTVLHRLNGLKMFRMLLRSEQDVQAVAQVDEAFRLMEDVHTNVIAGLALEDGETIAAWLPDAELEFGPMSFAFNNQWPGFNSADSAPKASTVKADKLNKKTFFAANPELAVIGPDGRELPAQFVGLDGLTGLSILKLAHKTPVATKLANASAIPVGANLRVLGPELATQTKLVSPRSLFVRMGETQGTVWGVSHAPTGEVARLKLRSPRLNLSWVGGVAVNEMGEAVGIVSGVEGYDATLLPAAIIQNAAQRVLTQQASVPRPFLGVRGEAVAGIKPWQVESLGWEHQRAASLVEEQRGILLTAIMPDSPAAFAALEAGDVILKVNGEAIQNGDDFSWFLDQAGASNSVNFTVVRPKLAQAQDVRVKLSGSLNNSTFKQPPRLATTLRHNALLTRGIETIALRPAVAQRLGASAGLLVVYVAPATDAAEAGLQAGDVIESIDGRLVAQPTAFHLLSNDPKKSHELQVVRKKQKVVVTLQNSAN
jgi:serine protease Do